MASACRRGIGVGPGLSEAYAHHPASTPPAAGSAAGGFSAALHTGTSATTGLASSYAPDLRLRPLPAGHDCSVTHPVTPRDLLGPCTRSEWWVCPTGTRVSVRSLDFQFL